MRRRVIVALGLGALVLSGCSATNAMQAATSEQFTISQEDVDTQVRQVMTDLGQAPGEAPTGLALATTQRLVQAALFTAKAAELGVSVTQAQVETAVAETAAQNGGQDALEQAALQAGIAKAAIDDVIRTSLLFASIGERLDGAGTADAQNAAARDALAAYSAQIDVQVAPRYGTWEDTSLQIVPGSTVASPAAEPPAAP